MWAMLNGNRELYQAMTEAGVIGRKSHLLRNVDASLEQTFAQAGNPSAGCKTVPDKDLTLSSSSCDNIHSQFVVIPMARRHQRGLQDKGSHTRSAFPVLLSPLSLSLRTLSCLLALSLFVPILSTVKALGQDADVEDVHVA